MKNLLVSALLALAPALVLAQPPHTPPKPSASAKKAPIDRNAAKAATAKATKAAAAKAQKPTSASISTGTKTAAGLAGVGAVGAGAAGIAALSSQELAIAETVHVGTIPCELGSAVRVTADAQSPGHFHVDGKGFKYHMAPVATSTGTVRLEDPKAGAVWLQIANKSMLMDQKRGQRLADECMSPAQVAVAESIKKNPPPSVLDARPNAVH